jgi:hypothetical protein
MLSASKSVDDVDTTSDDESNTSRAIVSVDANADVVEATSSGNACMTRNDDDDGDDDDGRTGGWIAMERMLVAGMGANANDGGAANARHEKRAARHRIILWFIKSFILCVMSDDIIWILRT